VQQDPVQTETSRDSHKREWNEPNIALRLKAFENHLRASVTWIPGYFDAWRVRFIILLYHGWARRCGDDALTLTWTHLNHAEVCWLTSFGGKSPSKQQLDSLQRDLWSDCEIIETSDSAAETTWNIIAAERFQTQKLLGKLICISIHWGEFLKNIIMLFLFFFRLFIFIFSIFKFGLLPTIVTLWGEKACSQSELSQKKNFQFNFYY